MPVPMTVLVSKVLNVLPSQVTVGTLADVASMVQVCPLMLAHPNPLSRC